MEEVENTRAEQTAQTEQTQPTEEATPTQGNKPKFSWKIIIILAAVVVAVILAIILGGKARKNAQYKKNLSEFVTESTVALYKYAGMSDEIRKVWHLYIFNKDKRYFNKKYGRLEDWSPSNAHSYYCSDFSEAVDKMVQYHKDNGITDEAETRYFCARRLYKNMTPPPAKYKDIHVYVKQMFYALEELRGEATSPSGSLTKYGDKCMEAVEDYLTASKSLSLEAPFEIK